MREDKLTPLQCKKFSCQSLARVVASLEVHTTASTTDSECRCGLDNFLVSIATFYAITCR